MKFLSPSQSRAARGLLNWSQPDLAERCGMHVQTISSFEQEIGSPTKRTLEKITKTFETNGIEFLEDEGIKKLTSKIKVFSGKEGFWNFYTDIYETVKVTGGDVLVSNANETEFVKWLGENREIHRQRMYALKNYVLKILIKEGDFNFASEYENVEYRWMPSRDYADVSFYIYGKKLAIIAFENNDVTIFLHDHPKIYLAFKKIFELNWKNSSKPKSKK